MAQQSAPIRVSLYNAGGELDHRLVATSAAAAEAAIDMILLAGELYDGDRIVVTGAAEKPLRLPSHRDVRGILRED